MSDAQKDILPTLFDYWQKIADKSNRILGEETACFFVFLYNDTIDIVGAIDDVYPEEERKCSLVFAESLCLLKELHWLHALFLSGNYPIVLSRLRFNWERIFRACYADYAYAYAQEHPNKIDAPGPTLVERHEWLMQRGDRLNWPTLIAPTLTLMAPSLTRLVSAGTPEEVNRHFRQLWDRLNRCVHPSGELREKLMGEPPLHLLDAFDDKWARETRADAVEVFELIFLAVLSRFPAVVPTLLADQHMFSVCPRLRADLQ